MLRNIILFTFFLICLSIKLVPALVDVNIDQSMENSGFHRLLTTNITLYGNLTSCKLLLTEKLPRDVFVPENDLDVINEYSEVHVKLSDKINVEKTATESVPFVAYIFLNKSQPVVTSNEFHTTYLYVIPLRIRYHDPKTEGGVREFKKPPITLYGFCPQGLNLPKGSVEELPCDPHSLEKCKWTSLPVKQAKLLPPFVVPVGNTDHFHYVFISTHISAYLGLLYIICSLFLVK